jgi:hypothetical protein
MARRTSVAKPVRKLTLTSPAFEEGGRIPLEYTRERANLSPALHWSGLPDRTRSLALLGEDPDAPGPEPFAHWVLYNIPPHASPGRPPVAGLPGGIAQKLLPHEVPGACQGQNDFGNVGYDGPEPSPDRRDGRLVFRLFALDTRLETRARLMTRPELLEAMKGHVLATAELTGTYGRQSGDSG